MFSIISHACLSLKFHHVSMAFSAIINLFYKVFRSKGFLDQNLQQKMAAERPIPNDNWEILVT